MPQQASCAGACQVIKESFQWEGLGNVVSRPGLEPETSYLGSQAPDPGLTR